jgi:hypothetical protein
MLSQAAKPQTIRHRLRRSRSTIIALLLFALAPSARAVQSVTADDSSSHFVLNAKLDFSNCNVTIGNITFTGTINGTIAHFSGAVSTGPLTSTTGTFSGLLIGTTETLSGALNGTTATFSGALNGTTETLSGALNGTTETLSGAFNGTTGNFSGLLTGTTETLSGLLIGTTETLSGAFNGTTGNFSGLLSGTTETLSGLLTGTTETLSGAFNGATGAFSSTLSSGPFSATTGNFSGLLSGTTETLSGAFNGATGVFSSTLSSGPFSATTGNFSGLLSGTSETLSGALNGTTETLSGAFNGATGVFSSTLSSGPFSATTGNFSGSLSGTTETLSGAFNGATGVFSSTLSSGPFSATTGNFSGAITGTSETLSGALSGTTATFSGGVSTPQLSNLTANGFVKTTGGTGALSVDTTRYLSVINVRDYGAVGDGTTPDGVAVNAAIAAAASAPGRAVFFPAGTYLLDAGHTIAPSAPAVLIGEGRDLTTLKVGPGSTFAGIYFQGPAGANSVVRNMTIDGNKANQTIGQQYGIIINYADNCVIDNVRVVNAAGIGIGIQSSRNTLVSKCRIENAEMQGIWTYSPSGRTNAGSMIKDCYITGSGYDGIQGTEDMIISGNFIAQCQTSAAGIYLIQGHVARATLSNNIIRQYPTGIDVDRGRITPADGGGAFGTMGVTITGNNCSENYNFGIATASNGTIISNNQVNDNGAGLLSSSIEPGVVPNVTVGGTGYHPNDILVLRGGTYTRQAKFRVIYSNSGTGALDSITDLAVMDLGAYTVFPAAATSLAVDSLTGTGSGAFVFFSSSILNTGGSGYAVGDILTGTTVTGMHYPAKFRVDAVSSGVITAYSIWHGGGYTGTLPTSIAVTGGAGTGAIFTPQFSAKFWQTGYTGGIQITSSGAGGTSPTTGVIVTGNSATNTTGFQVQQMGVILNPTSLVTGQPVNYMIANNHLDYNSDFAISKYFSGSGELPIDPGGGIITGNNGFDDSPRLPVPNNQNAPYTFTPSDASRIVWHQSASPHTYTIPLHTVTPFPIGTVIRIINYQGSGTLTIQATGGDTLARGDGVTGYGTRTMAAGSKASLTQLVSGAWVIDGAFL